jgi:hypothetical protein
LEHKIEELLKENNKLKESLNNGKVENHLDMTTKKPNNNNLMNNNQNQYIDMKQFKRIEPKIQERGSNRALNNSNDEKLRSEYLVKTNNLNAKTAEKIMKVSPGMSNKNNSKPLIAVNISNTNKYVQDEMSNYERHLMQNARIEFPCQNQNNNLQQISKTGQNAQLTQQKRNFQQMVKENYNFPMNVNEITNQNQIFQTPMPTCNYNGYELKKRAKYN